MNLMACTVFYYHFLKTECNIFVTDRFEDVRTLGKSILDKDPGASSVKDKLQKLGKDEELIDRMWADRNQQLQHAYELQVPVIQLSEFRSTVSSFCGFQWVCVKKFCRFTFTF